jgi:hypothetical protein
MDNDAKHFASSEPGFPADRLQALPLTEAEREEALRYVALGRRAAGGLLAASEVFRRMGALAALIALLAVIAALALASSVKPPAALDSAYADASGSKPHQDDWLLRASD